VADIVVPGGECFGWVLCWHSALPNGSTQGPHSDTAGLGQQLQTGFSKTDGWGRPLGVRDICTVFGKAYAY